MARFSDLPNEIQQTILENALLTLADPVPGPSQQCSAQTCAIWQLCGAFSYGTERFASITQAGLAAPNDRLLLNVISVLDMQLNRAKRTARDNLTQYHDLCGKIREELSQKGEWKAKTGLVLSATKPVLTLVLLDLKHGITIDPDEKAYDVVKDLIQELVEVTRRVFMISTLAVFLAAAVRMIQDAEGEASLESKEWTGTFERCVEQCTGLFEAPDGSGRDARQIPFVYWVVSRLG